MIRSYFRIVNALNDFELDLLLWRIITALRINVLARYLYLLVIFLLRVSLRLSIFILKSTWRLAVLLLRASYWLFIFVVKLFFRFVALLLRRLLFLAVSLFRLVYRGIPGLAALGVELSRMAVYALMDLTVYLTLVSWKFVLGVAAGAYRTLRKGMGGAVAGALVVSGMYLILSPTWTALYKFNILFHLAMGVLALAIVPRDYFVWLRRNFNTPTFLRLFLAPVALAAAAVFLPRAHDTLLRSSLILAAFALLLFINSIGLSRRRIGGSGKLETALMQALVCLWFFEAATGAVIALNPESAPGWIFTYHRWASFAFVGLFAARYLAGRRVCDCPGCIRWRYFRNALAAALAAVFLADAFVAMPQRLGRVYLSTVMLENRPPEQKRFSAPPGFRSETLDITRSCGEGRGCHAEIVADHLRSVHARSYYPEYFKRNFELMVSEVGAHNTVTCAACHTPSAVFNPALDYADFTGRQPGSGRPNQSCVFCHSVSEARADKEKPSASYYALSVRDGHLSLFLDGRTGKEVERVEGLDRYLLLLGRTGHAKVFSGTAYKGDEFCTSCHHHQIVSMNRPGMQYTYPKCVDCHMQPRRMLGLEGRGSIRNHIFPGSNLHFADFLGDDETEELNRRYAEGRIRTDIPPAWETVWDVREYRSETPSRTAWFSMQIELLNGIRPGGEARIRVFTTNNGIAHPFPASPLDLSEAWLELIVEDGAGNVFFHSGGMGAGHRVDPAAHRLGGDMIGKDGLPVEKNRVWQIEKKIVDRVIDFGEVVTDDYVFAVPEGVSGPVSISAHWRYRKLNQDFLDWAYPDGSKTAPVATVASTEMKAPVESLKVQRFKSSKVRKEPGGLQTVGRKGQEMRGGGL